MMIKSSDIKLAKQLAKTLTHQVKLDYKHSYISTLGCNANHWLDTADEYSNNTSTHGKGISKSTLKIAHINNLVKFIKSNHFIYQALDLKFVYLQPCYANKPSIYLYSANQSISEMKTNYGLDHKTLLEELKDFLKLDLHKMMKIYLSNQKDY